METSFFSGSENLYKYLVTIGLLLIVLSVYYPLKEKQELEILTIELESESKILNYKIKENLKNLQKLNKVVTINGSTEDSKKLLLEFEKLNQENNINQFEIEKKDSEIQSRDNYITLYKYIFWIFFPIGIVTSIFGFIKWHHVKKYDDNILKLENEKLGLEVKKLRDETE